MATKEEWLKRLRKKHVDDLLRKVADMLALRDERIQELNECIKDMIPRYRSVPEPLKY